MRAEPVRAAVDGGDGRSGCRPQQNQANQEGGPTAAGGGMGPQPFFRFVLSNCRDGWLVMTEACGRRFETVDSSTPVVVRQVVQPSSVLACFHGLGLVYLTCLRFLSRAHSEVRTRDRPTGGPNPDAGGLDQSRTQGFL